MAFLLQGATVIMLFWTHDLWLFYLFAVLFGIGFGGESGGFPILNRRYYGYAPTGSALGAQMLGAGLGMALGGWIGGVIFDIMGNYNVALMVSVAASLGGNGQYNHAGAHQQAADPRLGGGLTRRDVSHSGLGAGNGRLSEAYAKRSYIARVADRIMAD